MLHLTLLSISKLMYLELFGAQAQKVAVRCYSLSLDDFRFSMTNLITIFLFNIQ